MFYMALAAGDSDEESQLVAEEHQGQAEEQNLHPPSTRSQDVKDVLQMQMISVLLFNDPHSSSWDMLEEKNVKKEAGESAAEGGEQCWLGHLLNGKIVLFNKFIKNI